MRSSPRLAERPSKAEETPKRGRKRGPLWTRLLIVFGALLMVIGGGGIIAFKVVLDATVDSIDQVDADMGDSAVPAGEALKGAMNILLVGVDDGVIEGVDKRSDEPVRADSIMILHVPETHDRGYLISLPRDLWVRVPAYPKTNFNGGNGKLNSAYQTGYGDPKKPGFPGRSGGLELLTHTIREITGIRINAAATVNFTGFTAAVKLLGGVTMTIDERVESVHYGFDKNGKHCVPAIFDSNAVAHRVSGCKPRVFERGTRRLTAEEALDYTRQREWMELDDGDYGRQRHQQQFIKALVGEAKAQGLTGNLPKALGLIDAVGGALSMWTNGQKVEDWFFTLKDIASGDLAMIKTNNGKFTPANITGTSAEALSEESKQMLEALKAGQISAWLAGHPDWIGSSS